MTPHDESIVTPGSATTPITEARYGRVGPRAGHAYPATAPGVPLSAFAFAFAVTMLGLVQTGILTSAANDIFIATCFGIGAVGLLIGGLWEFRSGELFGGTFGVGYAGFLFSTALILKFFAGPIIAASGVLGFDHAFAAWLILWALFTGVFAIGASSISLAAFAPFSLAFVVLVLLAIANLGGTASWTGRRHQDRRLGRPARWFRGRVPGRRHRAQRDPRPGTAADVAGQVPAEGRVAASAAAPLSARPLA